MSLLTWFKGCRDCKSPLFIFSHSQRVPKGFLAGWEWEGVRKWSKTHLETRWERENAKTGSRPCRDHQNPLGNTLGTSNVPHACRFYRELQWKHNEYCPSGPKSPKSTWERVGNEKRHQKDRKKWESLKMYLETRWERECRKSMILRISKFGACSNGVCGLEMEFTIFTSYFFRFLVPNAFPRGFRRSQPFPAVPRKSGREINLINVAVPLCSEF